jgi:hypothetical protein
MIPKNTTTEPNFMPSPPMETLAIDHPWDRSYNKEAERVNIIGGLDSFHFPPFWANAIWLIFAVLVGIFQQENLIKNKRLIRLEEKILFSPVCQALQLTRRFQYKYITIWRFP